MRVNTDRTTPPRRPPPPAASATEAAAAGLAAAAAAAAGADALVRLGPEPVRVFFFILRSYEHMGMASIRCVQLLLFVCSVVHYYGIWKDVEVDLHNEGVWSGLAGRGETRGRRL